MLISIVKRPRDTSVNEIPNHCGFRLEILKIHVAKSNKTTSFSWQNAERVRQPQSGCLSSIGGRQGEPHCNYAKSRAKYKIAPGQYPEVKAPTSPDLTQLPSATAHIRIGEGDFRWKTRIFTGYKQIHAEFGKYVGLGSKGGWPCVGLARRGRRLARLFAVAGESQAALTRRWQASSQASP